MFFCAYARTHLRVCALKGSKKIATDDASLHGSPQSKFMLKLALYVWIDCTKALVCIHIPYLSDSRRVRRKTPSITII